MQKFGPLEDYIQLNLATDLWSLPRNESQNK